MHKDTHAISAAGSPAEQEGGAMPVTDALAYVHGTGTFAFMPITNSGVAFGDPICQAGSQYSNLELDRGTCAGLSPANTFQFPSVVEQGYTNPAEVVGDNGSSWGLHIRVMSAFNALTSISFQVCTSATTAALVTASPNPIAARTLTLAQLQDVGALFFIGVNQAAMLRFNRFFASLTGSNPTTGTIIAWFAAKEAGTQ